MTLRDKIESKQFIVCGELGPPQSCNDDVIRKKTVHFKGYVDAVNITDNQTAIVRLSSIASAKILLEEGIEPIIQMTCRDRNRIAIQSDLLGAAALGIENVLCLTGDHQRFGNHPESRGVFDLDSIQLVATLAQMNEGYLLSGDEMKKKDLITFDMGGTSADFSAIVDESPLWTEEGQIDGLPIRLPILDITTIGAGGGSIAWVDKGEALRVGPQSVGSDPGPACYDRGGKMPTVTDANLLSGVIDPVSFLGTGMTLSPDKARQAFESLAASAGLSVEETILGVRSVVNANMLRGIRRTTVEKGIDARYCTLLAFGGAGPIHAAELARELGIREVLVPPMAGMFSAMGILLSEVRLDFGETFIARWNAGSEREVENMLNRFKEEALRSLARQGLQHNETDFRPVLDMRYEGQSFHLPVAYSRKAEMAKCFHATFKKRYGYALEQGPPVEVVTVRLSAVTSRDEIALPEVKSSTTREPIGKRRILLSSGWETAPVYYRGDLGSSFQDHGPMVIEDDGCTVLVPPGCEISVEENSCLKLEVK